MAKKLIIVLLVLLVIGGGAFALVSRDDTPAKSTDTGTSTTEDMGNMDMTNNEQTQQSTTTNNDSNQTSSTSSSVEIKDYAYSPATITVMKGTTVTWTNQDAVRHDVTPDSPTDEFKKSDLLAKGETYSVTFNTVGTFSYHCSPHPYMKGSVVVTE